VEGDIEGGTVHGQAAVIVDKAQLVGHVHEETLTGLRGAELSVTAT